MSRDKDSVMLRGHVPLRGRADLPEFKPYVYNGSGKDEIRAAELAAAAEARKAERLKRRLAREAAERKAVRERKARLREAAKERAPAGDGASLLGADRCEDCGYLLSSPSHEASCLT